MFDPIFYYSFIFFFSFQRLFVYCLYQLQNIAFICSIYQTVVLAFQRYLAMQKRLLFTILDILGLDFALYLDIFTLFRFGSLYTYLRSVTSVKGWAFRRIACPGKAPEPKTSSSHVPRSFGSWGSMVFWRKNLKTSKKTAAKFSLFWFCNGGSN